jgi:hypothetical protein
MEMIRILVAAAVASFAFSSIANAQVRAGVVAVEQSETVVKLISVDQGARTAVVSTSDGSMFTINVPPEAQNLDRVKPGDLFKMRYLESLALALNKGGSASASAMQTVELAPKGATPGGKVVNTRNLTVTVQAIDRASRTLAVRGPDQNVLGVKVAEEVRSFDEIAIGDTITITYTEALALEMLPQSSSTGATR